MKNKNRYYRNKNFRSKCWKTIRNREHPFKTFCPYLCGEYLSNWSYEKQVEENFKSIARQARALESGRRGWFSAPSTFRRILNKKRKAKERTILQKINNGDYDIEIPKFKNDADWLYF